MITYKDRHVRVYPVLLSGKQGSGKTTTADLVHEYLKKEGIMVARYKFAQPIYEMHDQVLKVMKGYNIEVPVKDGPLLQLLGTEWGRQTYGKQVWVNCAIGRFESLAFDKMWQATDVVFLIDDLRFQNELEAFDFGYRVRLECDRELRKQRCSAWRENDQHPSEIDLDGSLGLFNEVLDTGLHSVDAVAGQIVRGIKDKFFDPLAAV